MITDTGDYIDGSWTLSVEVGFKATLVKIPVKSDTHIGGVMHKIQEHSQEKRDWSDYALWWPHRRIWLLHTRTTLDQYGVQSDDKLQFIPRHYDVKICLPSMQSVNISVNFASSVFSLVARLCKELGIRYAEELSLQLPLDKQKIKENFALPLRKRDFVNANLQAPPGTNDADEVEGRTLRSQLSSGSGTISRYETMKSTIPRTPMSVSGQLTVPRHLNGESLASGMNHAKSMNSMDSDHLIFSTYAQTQNFPLATALEENFVWLCSGKDPFVKARLNSTWLDTSRSLMEQGVDHLHLPTLHLKYKFSMFYDLNVKYDAVRLNQLYEHARWTLLTEVQQCTEHDAIIFAALQVQIKMLTDAAGWGKDMLGAEDSPDQIGPGTNSTVKFAPGTNLRPPTTATMPRMTPKTPQTPAHIEDVDEVDIMLTDLEKLCMGEDAVDKPAKETTEVPKLRTPIRVYREGQLGIKFSQRYICVIQDLKLSLYKRDGDTSPVEEYDLVKCHTWPQVSLHNNKFLIRLRTYGATPASLLMRYDSKEQYADNLAALHLTSEERTLASTAAFEKERTVILEKINLQEPTQPCLTKEQQSELLKNIRDYIPEHILKAAKSKDALKSRIAEAHANIRSVEDVNEAKLKYISAWQRLPHFGYTYFLVKFDSLDPSKPNKKPDLIAISPEGFMILKKDTREILSTWHYKEICSWNINWDAEKIVLQFRNHKETFTPLTANCKTVVEYIGGYILLSQRTSDKNQELDVKLYHRLTCAST